MNFEIQPQDSILKFKYQQQAFKEQITIKNNNDRQVLFKLSLYNINNENLEILPQKGLIKPYQKIDIQLKLNNQFQLNENHQVNLRLFIAQEDQFQVVDQYQYQLVKIQNQSSKQFLNDQPLTSSIQFKQIELKQKKENLDDQFETTQSRIIRCDITKEQQEIYEQKIQEQETEILQLEKEKENLKKQIYNEITQHKTQEFTYKDILFIAIIAFFLGLFSKRSSG